MGSYGDEGNNHGLRRQGIGSDLVMEASRRYRGIELSVYERSARDERTLLPYEELEVEWKRVEEACREVVNLLNRANRRVGPTSEILSDLKKTGRVLFELLIPPRAREQLNAASTRNLILYLDEKLVQIPWELLFNGQEFLCRRFAMGRIVSSRQAPTFLPTRSLRIPLQVLVLADPRGDLNGAYREGIEIRNSLDDSRQVFQVDFRSHPVTVSFVQQNLREYDIVHYAGHADYLVESLSESGWLLDDGRLKASEISAMGGIQPMPSLVFCNACQTAQTGEWQIQEGYEQQIFGLANAFLLSGVRHYIGTFWQILDEQSAYLAKHFYGNLARGENIGEAVRRTRDDLIRIHGEAALIWTSYVLYGDPTFCLAFPGRETVKGPFRREATVPESKLDIGQDLLNVSSGESHTSFSYTFVAAGGLILVLIVVAYSLFYPKAPHGEVSPETKAQISFLKLKKEVAKTAKTEITTAVNIKKDAEFLAMEKPARILPPAQTAEAVTPPVLPRSATPVSPAPTTTQPTISSSLTVATPTVTKIAEAPKYKIGDSWTLRLFDGQMVTRRIRAVENGLYVLECDSNRWQYLDRDLVLRREATPEGKALYPRLLNQRLLDFPLSLDKRWEFKILTAKGQRDGAKILPAYWRVFRYRVVGNETIETAAGTFGAFKIEERSSEVACDSGCDDVSNTAVIRQLWYAPQTRFLVKVAHVSGEPWQGGEADYEIVSLDLK